MRCARFESTKELPICYYGNCPLLDSYATSLHHYSPNPTNQDTGSRSLYIHGASRFRHLPVAVASHHGTAGSRRSISSPPFRRHKSLRHPRQESHHHAKRHPTSQTDTRRMGRFRLKQVLHALGGLMSCYTGSTSMFGVFGV